MIRVQNLPFSKYLSVTYFFSCSRQESSQQLQMWYHFVSNVNFEEGLLPPNFFLSVASSKALIQQRCSLNKYGISTAGFSFKIAILNIFEKFIEKHQRQSSYLVMSFQCLFSRKWCDNRLIVCSWNYNLKSKENPWYAQLNLQMTCILLMNNISIVFCIRESCSTSKTFCISLSFFIVCIPSLFVLGNWPFTKFSKRSGGLGRNSIFRWAYWERGWTFPEDVGVFIWK